MNAQIKSRAAWSWENSTSNAANKSAMLMAKYTKKGKKILSPKKLPAIHINKKTERERRLKMRWIAYQWCQVFFTFLSQRELVRMQAICSEYYDTIIPKAVKRFLLNKNRL